MQRVARNTAFMLAGEVGVKMLSFVFSVFVVRRLGANDYGRYSAALAFVTVFSVFTDLGTSSLSVREMARLPGSAPALLSDLTGIRFFLSVAALVVVPGIAKLLGQPSDMVVGIFVGCITLMIHAAAGPVASLLIARERLDLMSLANVMNQALFISFGTAALLLGLGFLGLLVATLLSQALSCTASVLLARRQLDLRLEQPAPKRWGGILKSSLPFFVAQVSDTSMRRFDTVFILFALSEAHVGWYSVAFNLVMMLLPLAQSLGLSLFPTLVRQYSSGAGSITAAVHRAARYVLLASLPIAVGASLLADRFITVLYTSSFEPAVPALRVLAWAIPPLFLSEILGRASSTLHLERRQARISVASIVLSVVLVVVGVETLGLVGAALAAVLTRLFVSLATILLVGPETVLAGNGGSFLRIAGAAALMGAGVATWQSFPELLPASPPVALAVLILFGVALYTTAVAGLQAIDLNERRYLLEVASGALRRLAWMA